MKMAMVRVGIDTGCGGMLGPIFPDGSFEFLPIPAGSLKDERTYGNTAGRHGRRLIEYFPEGRRLSMKDQGMHVDPEFDTFTYGDPTSPKRGLRRLEPGDYLVFYAGLKGWGCSAAPALYLIGYFEVQAAGLATQFTDLQRRDWFGSNFHVRHQAVYEDQKEKLVLVKGTPNSRLFEKGVLLSVVGSNRAGKPMHVLSPEMQAVFGNFDGKICFQRSPTRWVDPALVEAAARFIQR